MSTNINDLTNGCLEALFKQFSLFEWVKILRAVCPRWHCVLKPLCIGMIQPVNNHNPSDETAEPAKEIVPVQPGHYFYREIHFQQMVPLDIISKCVNRSNKFQKLVKQVVYFYEETVRKAFKDVFGEKLKFHVIHIARYCESDRKTKNLSDFCPMLLIATIFGYVEDDSEDDDNFFMKLTEIIQGMTKDPYLNPDEIENQVAPINQRIPFVTVYHPFHSQVECYSIHYTGQCPDKLSHVQLFEILQQIRPEKLRHNLVLHEGDLSFSNEVFKLTFSLSPDNLQFYLPFIKKHFKYSTFLELEFQNEKIKFDGNLFHKLIQFSQLEKLDMTNVVLDFKSLKSSRSFDSVKSLKLKNVACLSDSIENCDLATFQDEAKKILFHLFSNVKQSRLTIA